MSSGQRTLTSDITSAAGHRPASVPVMGAAKHKVLTVIGTRPEAIKLAPVLTELGRRADFFVSVVCSTGQHRELLDQALRTFDISADYNLGVMAANQSLSQVTSRIIDGLDSVVKRDSPDVILVQGDTTTAFCAALVAYYHQVRVGHVEAGLRTRMKYAPFPEEMNRCLIGQLADLHFAPTTGARDALLREGISPSSIYVTGNTAVDALYWIRDRVRTETPSLPPGLSEFVDGKLLVLVTGHRRESFGPGFEAICGAIHDVADAFPGAAFVYPVHLNPNVREPVNRVLGGHPRIRLIEPLSYAPFVWLLDKASVVLTDCGGVQEEAPCLGKPVLVMREHTERPEGVAAGNARLVGANRLTIVSALTELLSQPDRREAMSQVNNPYGDGKAACRIADILIEALGRTKEVR